MKRFLDRTMLFRENQSKWVALTDDDRLICSGLTLKEVLIEAKKRGYDSPVTTKIPDLRFEYVL